MIIPTGMRYTSRLEASEWRTVSCEHCPEEYAYKITREGTGSGRSVLFLDNDGARSRAQYEAEADLERQLSTAVEPVWCPRCGKYQPDMYGIIRMDQVILFGFLAFLILLVGAVVCMFWGDTSFWENLIGPPMWVAGGLALAAVLFGVVRSRRIDPNAHAETRAGTIVKRIPAMTREEFEALRAQLLAQGQSDVIDLRWSRR